MGEIMNSINDLEHSLAHMFDLLSREKEILMTQISKETNARTRSELNQDLEKVSGILSEFALSQ
jgi:hypothetical protein